MTSLGLARTLLLVTITVLVAPQTKSAAQATAAPHNLQSLVNDTAAQFQLAYRHDPAERERRREQLAAVVKAWRLTERSEVNNRLLADWLRAAMRSSMPGSREALPEAPAFGYDAAVMETGTPTAGREATLMTGDKSAGDPFGDDPLPAKE
jgi:hypothetical protein